MQYHVTIPAFTRTLEQHVVEADSPEEAVEAAHTRDPEEWVADDDYYEIDERHIECKLVEGE